MRFIVSVGWSIYPLGYFFGYLMGGVADFLCHHALHCLSGLVHLSSWLLLWLPHGWSGRLPLPPCASLSQWAGPSILLATSLVTSWVEWQTSFATMRFIVSVGWSIYPLGYFFGYLMGG